MTADEETDAQLAARVLRGEETAFTALMRRHKGWLYVFIRRHVRTSEDAYDLLQEAFVSAWRGMKGYDQARPFDAWLRRIALNKCRDRARRETVRRHVFGFLGIGQDGAEQVADATAGAEDVSIADETLRRLNDAMARLPSHLREALVLTALQGLSQREAAELLGVSAKVIETRAYRARKQLAEALDWSDASDVARLG